MSSPKPAAVKPARAGKRRARSTARIAADRAPLPREAAPDAATNGARSSEAARRLAAEIERGLAAGCRDVLSADALQELMAAVCRTYAAQIEAGEKILPLTSRGASATEVMITASGLLKAANLAVFELGMWQSWTGR